MLNKKNASAVFSMKPLAQLSLLACICYICLAASCHKDSEPQTPPVKKPTLLLGTSATLGSYLTDTLGNTLYYFSNDYNGQSNCTGGCLNVWPPYYAGEITAASLGTGLDLADFGTVTTPGGKQTTYKSWPLYYYAPASGSTNVREKPGETKGEGVGNVWYVAKPDYTVMLVNAQLIGNDGKSYKSDYTEGTGKTIYFSDAKGVTLYGFAKDSANLNKFTKSDFSNNAVWPIYEMDKMVVPSTLDKTLFSVTTVFGKKQLSYKGWPMYYFGADSLIRGRNKGVSVPVPKVWPAMVKDAPAAPAP